MAKNSSEIISLQKLQNWINHNGNSGYDPYDIKEHPIILNIIRKSSSHKFYILLREGVFELLNHFPKISRKIFSIRPSENAKAFGLLTSSYIDLYEFTEEEEYLSKIKDGFLWLEKNRIESEGGISWGYPFNWQSSQLIPKHTPNGIVTTTVAEAYWKWYKLTNDSIYLKTINKIAIFLISLPKDYLTEEKVCFSYTPVFINHVHNLNLFVAEFLIKSGIATDHQEWIDLGNKALNYTIADQMENGAFEYNGPPVIKQDFIDNYHTGFVLRMLHSCWKLTGRDDVYKALVKGYIFYRDNLFENDKIPKYKPNKKYRIDIHSCAESIHCLSILDSEFSDARALATNVLNWTIENLQDKKGYFYYGILKSRFIGITYKSKIAYLRWGQAWMLKALSTYLKNSNRPN